MESSLNKHQLWKFKPARLMFELTQYLEGVLVGLLLSDAWILHNRSITANYSISFKQGFPVHFEYLWHVYSILSPVLLAVPYFTGGYRNKTWTMALGFSTMRLPAITKLSKQFLDSDFKKIIPLDIYYLLTPEALAFWIMGDGEQHTSGLNLCTDSYTIQEVVILINVLILKYNLNCSLRKKVNPSGKICYRIYFPAAEMPKLRNIVSGHVIKSMQYKLTPSYIKKRKSLN